MDNATLKRYRAPLLGALAVLALLIILVGKEARQDEKVAKDKAMHEQALLADKAIPAPAPTAALPASAQPAEQAPSSKPAPADSKLPSAVRPLDLADSLKQPATAPAEAKPLTFAEKNSTDELRNVSGLGVMNKALSESQPDEPRKPMTDSSFPRYSKEFDPTKMDQINAGLKDAMRLQEQNPDRFKVAPLTPGGNLYGINTSNGKVAVLAKSADKWQLVGAPANATVAANGTYLITHTDETTVTIMNTLTTFTWRATLAGGKWEWKEIGGVPDDTWLK